MSKEEKELIEHIEKEPTSREIMLLEIIYKLEKENKNLKDINQKLLNKCQGRLSYRNEEIITELYTRLS